MRDLDIASGVSHLLLAQAGARTSTFTGTGVDITTFDGIMSVLLSSGAATAGTSPTLDGKLQESATLNGTYTDIAGATFTQVTDGAALLEQIKLSKEGRLGFVRFVGTIGGTNTPTFPFSVTLAGRKNRN